MKNEKLLIGLLIFLGLTSCSTYKKTSFPPQGSITQKLDKELEKSDVPAVVAIAVNAKGEKITYTKGKAVWQENTPITTNHIFRIASMTKLLTSIAAMQLVEEGKIELDDDLSEFLPEMAKIPILSDGEFRKPQNDITLRHLLTHTSGFGYPFTDEQLANFDKSNWEYKDLPRRFESGTQFLYGTSTDWVGKLVEKISERNLEDYFRQNITIPLEMNSTWYNVPDSLKNNIVSFGNKGKSGEELLQENTNRIPIEREARIYGGGGLFSSPEDYTKLLLCLLNNGRFKGGQLLKKATIDEVFKNQIGDMVLDVENNYYQKGLCCDFNGLIKKTSKWGLAGLLETQSKPNQPKKGTLSWGGIFNTYFFIDRESGIAASIYTQYLPFNHPNTTTIFEKFTKLTYQN